MRQTSERYYVRNDSIGPKEMMTLEELNAHCRMHGIPRDSVLVFRNNRKDGQSERNIVDVLEVHKYGEVTYVILGGHV